MQGRRGGFVFLALSTVGVVCTRPRHFANNINLAVVSITCIDVLVISCKNLASKVKGLMKRTVFIFISLKQPFMI